MIIVQMDEFKKVIIINGICIHMIKKHPCVHNGEYLRDVKWYYGRQVVLECGSCGYWDSYFLPGSEWKYAGHLGYSSLD